MDYSEKDILHLARLARLFLTDSEVSLYTSQISAILSYIARLQSLETGVVPKWSVSLGDSVAWREDEINNCEIARRESLLKAFPHREGNLLSVQAVFKHRI